MVFPTKGRQLYLGEGDFSFTRSLCEHHSLPKDAVVTCFAKDLTGDAAKNFSYLSQSGITVLTGIDATHLETHTEVSKQKYDHIIFNFPHTGHKMKIQLCRTLLREFLCSAAPLLTEDGHVWVTLCAGQGGTPGDSVGRAWSDSWQLTEQAAAACLVLRRLEPFRPELYPGYRPTGNRGSQARGFHTGRGVVHVLSRGAPLAVDSLWTRLAAGGPALRLDGRPLPLGDYWLRRLPPPADSLSELIARRVCAAAAPFDAVARRLLFRLDGRLYIAERDALPAAADGRDVCFRGVSGDEAAAPEGVCVTYTAVDCEVSTDENGCPLRTDVTVAGQPAAECDARAVLAQFGFACKRARQGAEDAYLASCGGVSVLVASACAEQRPAAARAVTTFLVDRLAACWTGQDDWRQATRTDFRATGTSLTLLSVHPPAHVFDMSFWLDGGGAADAPFSWLRLRRALRAALGHVLVSLTALDEYTRPEDGRRARTVRLQYQDLSGPLSRELARRLHVQVLPSLLSRTLAIDAR